MAAKKKPTAKQLAARAKFVKMVRERAAAKKAGKKIAGKKVAAKKVAKKKVATKYHKDTKSHNVNIRVVSGVGNVNKFARVVFTRYTTKYGKRVLKNTPLDIITQIYPSIPKDYTPISDKGVIIYKGKKQKFNYKTEKGEQIDYIIFDDQNYSISKQVARLSALSELF